MGRKLISSIAVLLLSIGILFAEEAHTSYGLGNIGESALHSSSYSGRISDALLNPASLPLIEGNHVFYVDAIMSEAWNLDVFGSGEPMPGLQNMKSELIFSFFSKNLSLTASTTTYFANRRLSESNVNFDIFNALGIQIDWAYAFPYVSLGMRIKGGNATIRENKTILGPISAIENAFFARFDTLPGNDYFSIGAAIRGEVSFFSASYMIEEIVKISETDGNLSLGWDNILNSMSFSMSFRYPEFTKRGDLNLVRPRASVYWKGNPAQTVEFGINGEVQLQLLPDWDFYISLGYIEKDHQLFHFDGYNGLFMTGLELTTDFMSIKVMFNVDTGSWDRLYPALSVAFFR